MLLVIRLFQCESLKFESMKSLWYNSPNQRAAIIIKVKPSAYILPYQYKPQPTPNTTYIVTEIEKIINKPFNYCPILVGQFLLLLFAKGRFSYTCHRRYIKTAERKKGIVKM